MAIRPLPVWAFQNTFLGSELPHVPRLIAAAGRANIDAPPRILPSRKKRSTAAMAEAPKQQARDQKLADDFATHSPDEYAPLASLGDAARLSREKIAFTRITAQSVELTRSNQGLGDSGLLGALQELEFVVLKDMRTQHEVVWSKGVAHGQWLAKTDEQKMAALAAEVALLKSEKFRQALELETTTRNLRLALNRNEELEDEVSKLRAAPPPVSPFYQGPIDPPPPTEPEMPSVSDLETSLMELGELGHDVLELAYDALDEEALDEEEIQRWWTEDSETYVLKEITNRWDKLPHCANNTCSLNQTG